MFVLTSDIQIGKYRFNGVRECVIKKSIHSVMEEVLITLPSISSAHKGKLNDDGTVSLIAGGYSQGLTRDYFTDGDDVVIRLGYNGEMQEEFRGFVRQRSLNMPLVVECEGYSRQLRLDVNTSKKYNKTTVKDILLDMLSGTDISLICDVAAPVSGIGFNNNNGLQVLDWLKGASDRQLSMFFIGGNTLYCGLPYTATIAGSDVFGLGKAGYRLGWNLKRDNALKMKIPSEPTTIVMQGRFATTAVVTDSKQAYAKTKIKSLLNHIPDNSTLQLFADEKKAVMNYTGLEGKLTGFLQPFCQPGWTANLVDSVNKDANGLYLVESTEVRFGTGGARRMVELGPKIS